MKYYSAANDAPRAGSDQRIRNNLIVAYVRVRPASVAVLRTAIAEEKKWAARPGSLQNPAELATVEAAADRVLSVLDELEQRPQ
jgi:hypothetical protein